MLANFTSPYDAHVIARFNDAAPSCSASATWTSSRWARRRDVVVRPVRIVESRVRPAARRGLGRSGGGEARARRNGTDTGGSIRQPAALAACRAQADIRRGVPVRMVAFASSLDQAGLREKRRRPRAPPQRHGRFDARDSTSLRACPGDTRACLPHPCPAPADRARRPEDWAAEAYFGAARIRRRGGGRAALAELRRLGATTPKSIFRRATSPCPYYVIAPPKPRPTFAVRRRAIRHRARVPNLVDMYCRTRAEGFGAEVKRRILIGTYVLSHATTMPITSSAPNRRLIAEDYAALSRGRRDRRPDVADGAFEFGAKTADPVQMYLNDTTRSPQPRGAAACRFRRLRAAACRTAAAGRQLFRRARM